MNSVIGNNRGGKTCEEILGCDRKTYFEYIQSKFVGEMNLNRMNEIHIDHIHSLGAPGKDENKHNHRGEDRKTSLHQHAIIMGQ